MSLGIKLQALSEQAEPSKVGSALDLKISRHSNELKRAEVFVDSLIESIRSHICSDTLPRPIRVPNGAPFRIYQWGEHVTRFDRKSVLYADHFNRFFDWCDENELTGSFVKQRDWDPDSINYWFEVQVTVKAG